MRVAPHHSSCFFTGSGLCMMEPCWGEAAAGGRLPAGPQHGRDDWVACRSGRAPQAERQGSIPGACEQLLPCHAPLLCRHMLPLAGKRSGADLNTATPRAAAAAAAAEGPSAGGSSPSAPSK